MRKHCIAIGGGGWMMGEHPSPLDQYICLCLVRRIQTFVFYRQPRETLMKLLNVFTMRSLVKT